MIFRFFNIFNTIEIDDIFPIFYGNLKKQMEWKLFDSFKEFTHNHDLQLLFLAPGLGNTYIGTWETHYIVDYELDCGCGGTVDFPRTKENIKGILLTLFY